MLATPIPTREVCKILKTGQVTSYVDYDDAWYANLGLGEAKEYLVLSVEAQYVGTTAITINGKTDVHSNNCVLDLKTGLMWSRYVSASVGPGNDGKLPWTTTGSGGTAEGIFPYCLAANATLLAGYGDWRVANLNEIFSLLIWETPAVIVNATAFPLFPTDSIWTSTQNPVTITQAEIISTNISPINFSWCTSNYYCLLVRGG